MASHKVINMIACKTTLKKFGSMGEKTGWTYIEISQKQADKLKPGIKRSYRVKGFIDDAAIQAVAMIPMGEGNFIIPVNASMRKAIRKRSGDSVLLKLEPDDSVIQLSALLLACLEDEPDAAVFFNSLPGSHQQYFSKWIESAKTDSTKTKRIAMAINAFARKLGYAEMMQLQKKEKQVNLPLQ